MDVRDSVWMRIISTDFCTRDLVPGVHPGVGMIDDFIGHVLGEAAFGRLGRSRRAQLLLRLSFGLLGAGLGAVGAIVFARRTIPNPVMHGSVIVMFVALSCVSLLNIGLGRAWRWPGILFVASFVSMIASRLAFGP